MYVLGIFKKKHQTQLEAALAVVSLNPATPPTQPRKVLSSSAILHPILTQNERGAQ
jgi:hypothetical protein